MVCLEARDGLREVEHFGQLWIVCSDSVACRERGMKNPGIKYAERVSGFKMLKDLLAAAKTPEGAKVIREILKKVME